MKNTIINPIQYKTIASKCRPFRVSGPHQWVSDSALKPGNGRCRVQSLVALVDLDVRSFLQNSHKYGLVSLRKTSEDTALVDPGPTCGQLSLTLESNPFLQIKFNMA